MYKNIDAIATAGNTSPTSGTKMLGKSALVMRVSDPLFCLKILLVSSITRKR